MSSRSLREAYASTKKSVLYLVFRVSGFLPSLFPRYSHFFLIVFRRLTSSSAVSLVYHILPFIIYLYFLLAFVFSYLMIPIIRYMALMLMRIPVLLYDLLRPSISSLYY